MTKRERDAVAKEASKPKRYDDDWKELTDEDVAQQDGVDNAIFNLVQELAPENADKIEWDLDWIAALRDAIMDVVVNRYHFCDEMEFYPYMETPGATEQIERATRKLDAKRRRRLATIAHALWVEQEREIKIARSNAVLELERQQRSARRAKERRRAG